MYDSNSNYIVLTGKLQPEIYRTQEDGKEIAQLEIKQGENSFFCTLTGDYRCKQADKLSEGDTVLAMGKVSLGEPGIMIDLTEIKKLSLSSGYKKEGSKGWGSKKWGNSNGRSYGSRY